MKSRILLIGAVLLYVIFAANALNINIDNIHCTDCVKGNKNIVSEEIPINDYSMIESLGPANIVYERKTGAPAYLRMEIDENLKEYVSVSTSNGKLIVKITEKSIIPTKFIIRTNSTALSSIQKTGSGDITLNGKITSGNMDIKMAGSGDLTAKDLNCASLKISKSGSSDAFVEGNIDNCNINSSGSGDFITSGLKCKEFNVTISGSGDLKAKIDAGTVIIKKSGSTDVTLSGTAEKATITSSGSGDVYAKDFKAKTMTVSGSGSCKMEVYAEESLNAKTSGSSNIRYKGNPKIKSSTSGSGKIKPI